jgi:hypothetical protein
MRNLTQLAAVHDLPHARALAGLVVQIGARHPEPLTM